MTKPERDQGRGQLHKRGARVWRDQESPTGPGQGDDADISIESEESDVVSTMEQDEVDEPVNAGPGGGGATESDRPVAEHEGRHGGPSQQK
jgi:hypothetical protein